MNAAFTVLHYLRQFNSVSQRRWPKALLGALFIFMVGDCPISAAVLVLDKIGALYSTL
ncbi:hypothetical protein [Burkholderia sp. Bp8963]|uniref:hypothetical protein n=1 Tax=Burkholderia sp. Bp8963 TaxID=2184547 RepID=UPI00163A3E8F|nr:hypothetical protein [Burkholderia sp. Bp8963]